MKKLAMLLAAIVAISASASAKDSKKASNDTNAAPQPKQCCAGEPRQGACPGGPEAAAPCPFEGIELTDAQKEQLKAMQDECGANKQKCATDKQARKQAKREARKTAQKEQLAKIKAILTPEQYVTFLENQVVNARQPKAKKQGKMERRGGMPQGPRMMPDSLRPAPQPQPEVK